MLNPLYEAFFKDSKGKIYHKGQFKQNQFAIKQLAAKKIDLESKLAKKVLHKKFLEKKLEKETNSVKMRILQYKINNLDKVIDNTSKLIRTTNAQIANRGKVSKMMANVNIDNGFSVN